MANKSPKSIKEQINLLKSRGMCFHNEKKAAQILSYISYYRLEGYWWDMQYDKELHLFYPEAFFEDVVARYEFDRQLRLILFNAIKYIEIALRTKMIYRLSLSYGALWYLDKTLFDNTNKHAVHCEHLLQEFNQSREVFVMDHRRRFSDKYPEAWKILEIASLGTLSKFYKNLHHQLPEKSLIAKEMGLHLHNELSSWLEAIVYVRNIIAHHARLWSKNMAKQPLAKLNNPMHPWLNTPLRIAQVKKPFLIISTMVYMCDKIYSDHRIRSKIISLIRNNSHIPVYKLGFTDDWQEHPLWNKE